MATKNTTKAKRAGPGRLSAEQAAELPDRLLDAALKAFAENGFANATMDGIAREAGASTKTIYARYSNKSDILKAVVKRMIARTIDAHRSTAPLDVETTELRQYVLTLCLAVARQISNEAAPLGRLVIAEGHWVSELRKLHDESQATGVRAIREGLELWHHKGLLPDLAATDVERAAVLCLSMATDWARIRTSMGETPGDADVERYVTFAVDVFLRGCGYRPDAAAKPKRRS